MEERNACAAISRYAIVLMKPGLSRQALLALFLHAALRYTPPMSIRKGGGDWEPMLLGIEPRLCRVCKQGLYRDKTMLRGGWSRCTVCDEFVHYSCLASGRFSFLKRRPRICTVCYEARERARASSPAVSSPDMAVGS